MKYLIEHNRTGIKFIIEKNKYGFRGIVLESNGTEYTGPYWSELTYCLQCHFPEQYSEYYDKINSILTSPLYLEIINYEN